MGIEVADMTWIDLVREYFPEVTDEEADCILWGYTGFPGFWNIPEDGSTPEECCRKQLKELKDKNGKTHLAMG